MKSKNKERTVTKPSFDISLGNFKATFWRNFTQGVDRYRVTVSATTSEGDNYQNHDITERVESLIAQAFGLDGEQRTIE